MKLQKIKFIIYYELEVLNGGDVFVMKNADNNIAAFYFHRGINHFSYDYFGCQEKNVDAGYEYVFRVWAPRADSVMLVSDFTSWDIGNKMSKISDNGIWEIKLFSKIRLTNKYYKFKIWNSGKYYYKADPYAFQSQYSGECASIISDNSIFQWKDENWLNYRKKQISLSINSDENVQNCSHNICKLDLSFLINGQVEEKIDEIFSNLKKMGFTHIEFSPFAKQISDGLEYNSFGFFSTGPQFETPHKLKLFINKAHRCGIGVILKWLSYLISDEKHGLYEFDGMPLYDKSYANGNSKGFNLEKEEVQSFLISNAMFWLRKYHIDGLRIDCLIGDDFTASFLRKLKASILSEYPDEILIFDDMN